MTNGNDIPVEQLVSHHFKLGSDDIVILKRKRNLQEKQPLYMFNLSKRCYVSSLKPTLQENVFCFDVRVKGGLDLYNLKLLENGSLEVSKIS